MPGRISGKLPPCDGNLQFLRNETRAVCRSLREEVLLTKPRKFPVDG